MGEKPQKTESLLVARLRANHQKKKSKHYVSQKKPVVPYHHYNRYANTRRTSAKGSDFMVESRPLWSKDSSCTAEEPLWKLDDTGPVNEDLSGRWLCQSSKYKIHYRT